MILKTLSILAVAGFAATVAVSNADAAQWASMPIAAQQTGYDGAYDWFAANGAEAIRLQHGGAAHNTTSVGDRGDDHGGHGGSHGGHR